MEGKVTQKKLILEHLKVFGSIEPLEALREYGVYRLGARIADLKADGHNIVSEPLLSKSKITGHTVRFAKYILR